jgi:hypothetical protein
MVERIGKTRRYQATSAGLKAIAALVVLREKAIRPLLTAAQQLHLYACRRIRLRWTAITKRSEPAWPACCGNSDWPPDDRRIICRTWSPGLTNQHDSGSASAAESMHKQPFHSSSSLFDAGCESVLGGRSTAFESSLWKSSTLTLLLCPTPTFRRFVTLAGRLAAGSASSKLG